MNLIEQLGNYEQAKALRILAAEKYDCGVKFTQKELELSMLEYRRQHNIFEIGDLYVFTEKYSKQSAIHKVDSLKSGKGCIRHATDEEIAAGHRL